MGTFFFQNSGRPWAWTDTACQHWIQGKLWVISDSIVSELFLVPFSSIWFSWVFFCCSFFSFSFWNLFTAEDSFLSAIINYTNSSTVHFKLSPTYVLYLACRYVLSSQSRADVSPAERTHKVIALVNKMVSMMEGVIQVSLSPQSQFSKCASWFIPAKLLAFMFPTGHTSDLTPESFLNASSVNSVDNCIALKVEKKCKRVSVSSYKC